MSGCGILYVLAPRITSDTDYPLPFEMWIPFELNKYNYCLVYFYQSFRVLYTGFSLIAHDCLFLALSMRACHQIELLIRRLNEFPDNVKLLMENMNDKSRYNVERILFTDLIRHLKMINL